MARLTVLLCAAVLLAGIEFVASGCSDRKGLRVLCAVQRYRLRCSPTVGHRPTELSLTLRFTRKRHRLVTHSAA